MDKNRTRVFDETFADSGDFGSHIAGGDIADINVAVNNPRRLSKAFNAAMRACACRDIIRQVLCFDFVSGIFTALLIGRLDFLAYRF